MYEQSAAWNSYYNETEPSVRRRMLDELCMLLPDDGANAYRLLLWNRRHTDPKNKDVIVDHYLYQCVNLGQLYKSAKFFRKRAVKEVSQLVSDLGFDRAGDYGEPGEKALYWEIRNGAARYFATFNSPLYNRALFGLMSSNDGGRRDRMVKDVWAMSRGAAIRTGCCEQLRIWEQAVLDEFERRFPDAREAFEACDRKNKEN